MMIRIFSNAKLELFVNKFFNSHVCFVRPNGDRKIRIDTGEKEYIIWCSFWSERIRLNTKDDSAIEKFEKGELLSPLICEAI